MEAVKTMEYKGYRIEIYQDENAESHNFGKMLCFHKRYSLGDKVEMSVDEARELAEKLTADKNAVVLPLYLYDHSGISISTKSFIGRAHHAEWDSGRVGFIYADANMIRENFGKNDGESLERARELLEAEVETYDQYLRGEVYGYRIFDGQGNEKDSCWGFFDDLADENCYILAEAKSMVDYYKKNVPEQMTLPTIG